MRYLLPAILLLGTQIASAQSILKDKDDKELSDKDTSCYIYTCRMGIHPH